LAKADLSAFVTELSQHPAWGPLRAELQRERDFRVRRLVSFSEPQEALLGVAGEVRGIDIILSTITLKGQE
jgi:hypothetical protein